MLLASARIVVSHHKCAGRPNFGRMSETLPKFSEAMKQQEIAFDVYPYIAGSTILRTDMLERADKVLITWSDKVPGSHSNVTSSAPSQGRIAFIRSVRYWSWDSERYDGVPPPK